MMVEAQTITTKGSSKGGPILPLLLVFALLVQIWLLVHDLRPQTQSDISKLGTPVAELMQARKRVKTQDPGALIWTEVLPGAPLYRKQALLTADDGRAEIAFADGAGVIVGANTWLQIEQEKNINAPIIVSLVHGKLESRGKATGPKNIVFQLGNARVLPAAGAELSLISDGNASGGTVQVRTGTVEFRTRGGTVIANAGEEASIDTVSSDRAPVPRKAPFILLSPRSDEWIPAEHGALKEIVFQWAIDVLQVSDSPMQIELSRDETFARETRTGVINASYPPIEQARLTLVVPTGETAERWYWRVRALRRAQVSPIETFLLGPGPRPTLKLPDIDSSIREGNKVEFVWAPVDYALDYEIEVTPESGAPLNTTVARTFSRIESLKKGTYNWRVRARLRDGGAGYWSGSRRFRVIDADASLPPPSQLHEPEFETVPPSTPIKPTTSWFDWLLPEAWAQEDQGPTFFIRLGWDPVRSAASYRLQISKRSSFLEPLVDIGVKETQWTWPYRKGLENSRGRVFYRVASVDANGKQGEFSEARPISIPEAIREKVVETQVIVSPAETTADEYVQSEPKAVEDISLRLIKHPLSTWQARITVGAENHSQSGLGGTAEKVEMTRPFFSPRIALGAQSTQGWADLEISGGSFVSTDLRNRAQPETSTFQARLMVGVPAKNAGGWKIVCGGTLERATRWSKTAPQFIESQGALALGPFGIAVRESTTGETGVRLALPITGLVFGGQYGASIAGWKEWRLFKAGDSDWGLRVGAEYQIFRWSSPHGATTHAWALFIGPVWQRSFF